MKHPNNNGMKMSGSEDRLLWVSLADRLACKVLPALAAGELRKTMPVDMRADCNGRESVTHLEAFARLLYGLAPWLELDADLPTNEKALQIHYRSLALQALDQALDPDSPDKLNFEPLELDQPLVDIALLAAALLRAPNALLANVQGKTRERLIQCFQNSRKMTPFNNNWLFFPAMIETAMAALGEQWHPEPIIKAFKSHETWYVGDGWYRDGPCFSFDYYNSFMIHPFYIEVLEGISPYSSAWEYLKPNIMKRASRHAEQLERMISPEGTYPAIGRSITYRAGALHLLSLMALRNNLGSTLKPAQVRSALSAVLRRQITPGTFDANGWLTIGFTGHESELAERYISTGSVYFMASVLPALGLNPDAEFWSAPDADWTARKIWGGECVQRDGAMEKPLL